MTPARARRMPTLFTAEETGNLLAAEEKGEGKAWTPTLTAANSCLTHDGAAFVILVSGRLLEKWKGEGNAKRPWARLVNVAETGVNPRYSPLGALKTGDILLAKTRLSYADVDVFEYNEAFAVISALFAREHPDCLSRYLTAGGALAYGHPYGASGAILCLHALMRLRQEGGRYGLCSIAGAGGTGGGFLLERCQDVCS